MKSIITTLIILLVFSGLTQKYIDDVFFAFYAGVFTAIIRDIVVEVVK